MAYIGLFFVLINFYLSGGHIGGGQKLVLPPNIFLWGATAPSVPPPPPPPLPAPMPTAWKYERLTSYQLKMNIKKIYIRVRANRANELGQFSHLYTFQNSYFFQCLSWCLRILLNIVTCLSVTLLHLYIQCSFPFIN